MFVFFFFSSSPFKRCYDESLVNKSIAEIRDAYSSYKDPHCTVFQGNGSSNEKCDRWIYDYDHGYRSMSSELNWVCDSAWKSTIGQSMFFVGSVIGTQSFGALADTLGRLPVLIFANIMALVGNGITVFSTNAFIFSVSRFISGLAVDSNFLMMYILGEF